MADAQVAQVMGPQKDQSQLELFNQDLAPCFQVSAKVQELTDNYISLVYLAFLRSYKQLHYLVLLAVQLLST